MGLLDRLYDPLAKATAHYVAQNTDLMEKAVSAPVGVPVRRTAIDVNNMDITSRRKPSASVSFETLRRFSVTHEISRICINTRKRQISSLDWEIIPTDPEDKTDYTQLKKDIRAYFKGLGGYRVRFREFQDTLVEDLLVLDAACLYKMRTRGNLVDYYMPVDAATIKLRVDAAGNTPQPPEVAYVQFIRGTKVGEYTAEDMVYEMMNPRTDTPYGLAPLESLILVVNSALKSNLYNLDYLTAGNIPEGLLSLPEGWTTKQIQEFMDYFDALVAGDTTQQTKMKPIPGGGNFIETKKRSDMAFKEFNEWLMRVTCAMFDIQPQEIGFTADVNRATGQEQSNITTRRGILPLANLLKEIFDDIIQIDLGHPELQFHYVGLEDKDALQDAQTNEVRLRSGVVTIDEVRKEEGLDPLGIDKPYVLGAAQFLTENVINGVQPEQAGAVTENTDDAKDTPATAGDGKPASDTATEKTVKDELRRFKTVAIKRLKTGKTPKSFSSDVLKKSVVDQLNLELTKAASADDAKAIFDKLQAENPRFL